MQYEYYRDMLNIPNISNILIKFINKYQYVEYEAKGELFRKRLLTINI